MKSSEEYAVFGRQIGYVLGGELAVLLLAFVQLPILTKGLGANLYGNLALINITISLIAPVATLGLTSSVIRFLAAQENKAIIRDDFLSAYSVVFVLGAILSTLLFLLSEYLAMSIFKDINAVLYIKLASVLILLGSTNGMAITFFKMQRKMGLYVIINLSYHIFMVGLIILSILLGYELTGVISAMIISLTLFTLVALFFIIKQVGFRFPTFSRFKPYLKYGIPLTLTPALMWIITAIDRYMISYFIGVASAGVYSAAYRIGHQAFLFVTPVATVLFPMAAKSYGDGDISQTKNYLRHTLKYFMMLTIPAAFGLSILAKPLLSILTTPEFLYGSTIIPFIAFNAMLYGFYVIGSNIFNLYYRTVWIAVLLGLTAVINIVLNLTLIPQIGILGAAIATLISYISLSILNLVISRRYMKFDIGVLFMLKSLVASLVMVLCIWLINPSSLLMVLVSIVLGALIYFAVLILIKGFSSREITFFIEFARDSLKWIRMVK